MAAAVTQPPYAELAAAWRALRGTHGLSVREVACVGAPRTLLAAELPAAPGAPAVAIAAGVHGDEPAAAWALLGLARDGLLDRRFAYRLWPCTNPSGYALGTRENADGDDVNRSFARGGTTPEARAIVTATRDRRYALVLDLHEDYEADGFYCYEPTDDGVTPFGEAVVRAVDDAGLPVQDLDDAFDLAYGDATHLRTIARGHVRSSARGERSFFAGHPFSIFMLRRAARHALTLESARRLAWDARIATHRVAVVAALDVLALRLERARAAERAGAAADADAAPDGERGDGGSG